MLEPAVQRSFEEGRAAWPAAALELELFARRAAVLAVRPEDLTARGPDLFLAWACAGGDAAALAYFERDYLLRLETYVPRLAFDQQRLDELRQRLRIRLLVGEQPRIGRYSGRGPLGAWVRVSARRLATDDTRAASNAPTLRSVSDEELVDIHALAELVSSGATPEDSTIRTNFRSPFQRALERSLAALDRRDKTVLRMHFVDGLNIEAICRIYRVHRGTIARWLTSIRERVLDGLRSELPPGVIRDPAELWSLIAIVRDDLSVSLERILIDPCSPDLSRFRSAR